MENISKISSSIIEIEIDIKLFEYLKRKNVIDDGMYDFCISKLFRDLELERSKINDDYRILT